MQKVSLAALIFFEDIEGGWMEYQDKLYSVFCRDLKDSEFTFKGKIVKIRYQPIEFGKEEAFFHITCQDYKKDGDRVPDLRRCERIAWVRQFIEAADANVPVEFEGSTYELKMWIERVKNDLRYHILCEELRFMVVVSERDRYSLLITAFYFEYNHTLRKKLEKYKEYKAKNAPQ